MTGDRVLATFTRAQGLARGWTPDGCGEHLYPQTLYGVVHDLLDHIVPGHAFTPSGEAMAIGVALHRMRGVSMWDEALAVFLARVFEGAVGGQPAGAEERMESYRVAVGDGTWSGAGEDGVKLAGMLADRVADAGLWPRDVAHPLFAAGYAAGARCYGPRGALSVEGMEGDGELRRLLNDADAQAVHMLAATGRLDGSIALGCVLGEALVVPAG